MNEQIETTQDYELSDADKILAGEVTTRVGAYLSTADQYHLQMLDCVLSIFAFAWEGKEFPQRISTIEEFIMDLISQYKDEALATPDGVEKHLRTYRQDFALAIFAARRLAARGVPVLSPELKTVSSDSFCCAI